MNSLVIGFDLNTPEIFTSFALGCVWNIVSFLLTSFLCHVLRLPVFDTMVALNTITIYIQVFTLVLESRLNASEDIMSLPCSASEHLIDLVEYKE